MSDFLKKKQNLIISLLALLLIIVLGWVFALGGFNFSSENSNQLNNNEETTIGKSERTLSGKSMEDDQKDAMKSAQDILIFASQSPDPSMSVEERLTNLEKGDLSVVSEDLKNKMRFKSQFETDVGLQVSTYQSLITLSSYIAPNGKADPVSEDIWKNIYVDQEAGIAYIPLSIFSGPGMTFSLELVYTDGDWKLSPYSMLDIVRLSANMQELSKENEQKTNG